MPPTSSRTPECSNSAFQGDRVGELPGLDPPRDGLKDAAVDRIGEMHRREVFRHPLIGAVIRQQCAKQRLFRLQIGRRQALREPEQRRIGDGVHAAAS